MFTSILDFLKEKNSKIGTFRADYAILLGGIVIGIAIIVFAIVFSKTNAPITPAALGPTDGRTGLEIGDAPVLGNADAPHTIVEFFDFQCVACGAYFTKMESQIRTEFIETGKARVVAKPLRFIDEYAGANAGTESRRAAIAALCAGQQGGFWKLYDAIFTAEQDEVRAGKQNENSGNLTDIFFTERARDAGLNEKSFTQCVSSGTYDTALQEYLQDATAAMNGQVSTPSVFVDGQRLQNPFDLDEYKKLIP